MIIQSRAYQQLSRILPIIDIKNQIILNKDAILAKSLKITSDANIEFKDLNFKS